MAKKGLLERLAEGPIIGDGGFVFALEKRGYVKAGPWTPEAAVEHPEAVLGLHREFLRAGSDVMQAFTFYASDDKLDNRGHGAAEKHTGKAINMKAAELAKQVAAEGDALTLGGVSQCPTYLNGAGKAEVQAEFRKQIQVFVEADLDFLLCEYFEHIEEMEWAIEVCKETGKAVASTMCIGPKGDIDGVSASECAVRMARAGSNVVGVNCHFDPFTSLETVKLMKQGLEEAGLLETTFLMCQPLAYHTPDAGKQGFIDLPEFPFALEPRVCTRWDMHAYARQAYELGVRYIGGCCGFEAYHIRAISEELSAERGGKVSKGSEKHDLWGGGLVMHTKPWVRARARKDYWDPLCPCTGRPYSASLSKQQRGNTITASNKSRVSAIQNTSNTPASSALPATTVSSDAAVLQEINCNVDVTHKRKEPSGETHNATNKTKRSTGVSHSDYEKLKRENKRLAKEIDMYKNNWMPRPSGPTASYFIDVGKILSGFSNVETGEEDACKKLEDITLILKMSDTELKLCEHDTDITKTCRQIVKYIYRDPQIRSRMLVSTMDVDILKAIQDYARMVHPLQSKTHNSVLNNAVGNVFATEKRKIERHETGEEASTEMDDSVEDT